MTPTNTSIDRAKMTPASFIDKARMILANFIAIDYKKMITYPNLLGSKYKRVFFKGKVLTK